MKLYLKCLISYHVETINISKHCAYWAFVLSKSNSHYRVRNFQTQYFPPKVNIE